MSQKFGVAVKGIIRRGDGKILIVKRSAGDDHKPGVWETVGGGMEEAISPEENLKREIMEETGLSILVREPFNVFTFTKDTGEFKLGITFICEYLGGEVKLSHEHTEFQWIEPKDFSKYASVPSLHKEIAHYSNKFSGEHERFVISQKAVMIRDNKCFIAEGTMKDNVWDLPGGRINNNEGSEAAFRREVKEELGIDNFEIISVVDYEAWRNSKGFAVCGVANLIQTDEEINLSDEHVDGKWITEEEIDQHKFIWPEMRRMIKKGFEYHKNLAKGL